MTNFIKIINEIIEKEGGQEEVAEKLGVTSAYISMFSNGKRKASKKVAEKIELHYGYNANDLLKKQALEEFAGKTYDLFDDMPTGMVKEPEPDKKNDALQQLKKVTNGRSPKEPEILTEAELVPVKTIIIPITGFAGLKKAFYAEEYINTHFEITTTFYPKSERVSEIYKIPVSGNSLPDVLEEGMYVDCEPIPQIDWYDYKFKPDKVYCFWHHLKGIFYKYAENRPFGRVLLKSTNEDKLEYGDEEFDLGEFKNILIIRKKEKYM